MEPMITSSMDEPEPEPRFIRVQGYEQNGNYRYFQRNTSSGDNTISKPLKRLNVHRKLHGNKTKAGNWKKNLKDLSEEEYLIKPQSAISLLLQIEPQCSFKVSEDMQDITGRFLAEVLLDNVIVATGKGRSIGDAKTAAAENALKVFFKPENLDDVNKADNSLIPLASFALYKLIKEWKDEKKTPNASTIAIKEPPQNALEMHPCTVLSQIMPGCKAYLVRQTGEPPEVKYTWGYKIGKVVFTGTARNKKIARRKAAEAVLYKFFGLDYSPKED